jgi:hypothetical protein
MHLFYILNFNFNILSYIYKILTYLLFTIFFSLHPIILMTKNLYSKNKFVSKSFYLNNSSKFRAVHGFQSSLLLFVIHK